MREIKFRAWDKINKRWIAGIPLSLCIWLKTEANLWLGQDLFLRNIEFQQFIGLYDKNGREIYEGDILRQEEDNSIQIVFFEHGCFTCHSGSYLDYYNNIKNHIIIGNIYENPELLKEK
jgi:hypothetical protein